MAWWSSLQRACCDATVASTTRSARLVIAFKSSGTSIVACATPQTSRAARTSGFMKPRVARPCRSVLRRAAMRRLYRRLFLDTWERLNQEAAEERAAHPGFDGRVPFVLILV